MYDVIIIGSGPAGYTAAVYTSRAALKTLIVAGSVGYGGMLMNTTLVENYPGFKDGIQGPDLMEEMREQAQRFGAEMIYEDATALDLAGDVKTVTTDDATYQARAVIIATGSGYRTLDVPGEAEHLGHGVSYCATCDGFFFKGQPIMVVGGGGFRDGRSHVLDELRFLGDPGASSRRIPRLEGYAAKGAVRPQDSV